MKKHKKRKKSNLSGWTAKDSMREAEWIPHSLPSPCVSNPEPTTTPQKKQSVQRPDHGSLMQLLQLLQLLQLRAIQLKAHFGCMTSGCGRGLRAKVCCAPKTTNACLLFLFLEVSTEKKSDIK